MKYPEGSELGRKKKNNNNNNNNKLFFLLLGEGRGGEGCVCDYVCVTEIETR